MTKATWNESRTNQLIEAVANVEIVSQDLLVKIAAELDTTSRSIGSKLRSLVKDGSVSVEVQKASEVSRLTWAEGKEAALVAFLSENEGVHTYSEISAIFLAGEFTTKQLQGKILSLELTDSVKKTEKPATVRTYSEDEEATYVQLAAQGESLEAVAEALGKSIQSVRGKGLSLMREERIEAIPTQTVSQAKVVKEDILEGLEVASMTVAEIAEATARSARGIKNALSRRGLACKDHDGAARRMKLDKKSEGTSEA